MSFLTNEQYNTSLGIAELVKTLVGLNQLASARRAAYYERKEKLDEFWVLGRYYLDRCGNFCKAIPPGRKTLVPKDAFPSLPDCLTNDEFKQFVADKGEPDFRTMVSLTDYDLPEEGTICSECAMGWNISNCHDVVLKRPQDEWIYFHTACHTIAISRNTQAAFEKVFADSGFATVFFQAIPNEYGSGDWRGPWFIVNTPFGGIKIGWRKRVISIHWDQFNLLHVEGVPDNKDITHGADYTHAYGYDKATEYLRIIRETCVSRQTETV